jgi:copper chaperone CopZ
MAQIICQVDGMKCQSCVSKVEAAISQLDDLALVEVDLEKKQVKITSEKTWNILNTKKMIESLGFSLASFSKHES